MPNARQGTHHLQIGQKGANCSHLSRFFMQSGVTFRMENRSAGCKTSVNGLISSTNSPGTISWERSKVTSRLAQNYEKISKSPLRGGSFPREQATFAREKSQLLHRLALGISGEG